MNEIRELANVVHRGGGFYSVILKDHARRHQLQILLSVHCVVRGCYGDVWQVRFKK